MAWQGASASQPPFASLDGLHPRLALQVTNQVRALVAQRAKVRQAASALQQHQLRELLRSAVWQWRDG